MLAMANDASSPNEAAIAARPGFDESWGLGGDPGRGPHNRRGQFVTDQGHRPTYISLGPHPKLPLRDGTSSPNPRATPFLSFLLEDENQERDDRQRGHSSGTVVLYSVIGSCDRLSRFEHRTYHTLTRFSRRF